MAAILLLVLPVLGSPLHARGQAVPTASPAASAGIDLDAREQFYALEDSAISEVIARLNGMRLLGPNGPPSQGLTTYHILPRWRPAAAPGSCRVRQLRMQVRVLVTLPRWTAADAAPASEQERWARILEAIRSHEYRHRDLTIAAAESLHETLSSLEAGACSTLGRAVDAALAIAHADLQEAHAALDAATPSRIVGS